MGHVLKVLSGWLVQQDAIESSDRELYEYAIYSFLISIMPLTVFLIVSGIIGMLPEGGMIIIPFMVIRKFSGGYHAKHVYTCLCISVSLLGICLYLVVHVRCIWIFHMLTLISALSIIFNSPIDSDNKKLEEDEVNQYRRTTCLLVIIIVVIYCILVTLNQSNYAICFAVSLILTAIL